MVIVKRRVDGGSNGYGTLIVPRAPRSTRKRNLGQKSLEDSHLCAIELLATVAGKLLEESECSSAASSAAVGFDEYGVCKDGVKKEPLDVDKSIGRAHDDRGRLEGSVYFSRKLKAGNDGVGEPVSFLASSLCSEKVDPDSKSVIQKYSDDFVKLTSDDNLGNDVKIGINRTGFGDPTMANMSNSEEIIELPCSNCRDNDVKIGSKDDDEIPSRCSKLNNTRKIFRSTSRTGDRRFKKLQISKHWKTVPKLKDFEHINSALHVYHNKRPCYEIDRSQRNTPFKKRKLIERSSIVTYDGGISSESVSNSPEKSKDDDKNTAGNRKPLSGFKRQNSRNSRNSHVRLRIKSFKIPELFVEVPESTTVASLKSTVLEAVTSILGGGLRVGVLVHGKKTRDDEKTLLETGISENVDMDTVGFMLEPKGSTQPSPPISPKTPTDPLFPYTPKFTNSVQVSPKEEMFLLDSTVELSAKNVSDSKVIAVLPADDKSNHSEIGQRRIRRPFSVSEVEALVHAVEKLGTGRWRDVKLCSFENVKHRTYVDLKDKWKTLVHTAKISPQQRRGEQVPQALLDRVLDAQAYWCEHQIGKQHSIIPELTDSIA